jgi:hypothetical protein
MGDQVYRLKDGESIPVEPVGDLAIDGWMPGTWARYSTTPASNFSGAIAAVDRSDGTGVIAGFLVTGPQHRQPVEKLSDMWTTNTRQRPGGDTHADWGTFDAGADYFFDSDDLLQKAGNRIVQLYIAPSGYHRFYVFETDDSGGAPLTYTPGDLLYVSSNGLLTVEQETPSHTWTGYVVAQFSSDEEGDFIVAVAAAA